MKNLRKVMCVLLCAAMLLSCMGVLAEGENSVSVVTGDSFPVKKLIKDVDNTIFGISSDTIFNVESGVDPENSSNKVVKFSTKVQDKAYSESYYQKQIDFSGLTGYSDLADEKVFVMGYDFYIDELYPSATRLANNSSLTILDFRHYDGGGTGSGTDYSPRINGVITIAKGENDTYSYKTVNGDTLSGKKWYTIYNVFERYVEGGKYKVKTNLYLKEKDAAFSTATCIAQQTDTMARDGFPQKIYLYFRDNHFGHANSSVLYFDNVFLSNAIMLNEDVEAKVYNTNDKFSVTAYLAPGFDKAEVNLCGESVKLTDNGTGFYKIERALSDVLPGISDFSVKATYGSAETKIAKQISVEEYEAPGFELKNSTPFIPSNSYYDNSQSKKIATSRYEGFETATQVDDPAGVAGNKVTKAVSKTGNGNNNVFGFKYGTSYTAKTTSVVSVDMYLDNLVCTSTTQYELMRMGNEQWTMIRMLNIVKDAEGNTVITTDDSSKTVIQQKKWYSLIAIYETGTSNWSVYILEKGQDFSKAIRIANSTSNTTVSKNTQLYVRLFADKRCEHSDSVKPVVYFDNAYASDVFDVKSATNSTYTSKDTYKNSIFVMPGFDSASVTIGGEKVAITDNKTGYYEVEKDLSAYTYESLFNVDYEAKYKGKAYKIEDSINITSVGYTYWTDLSGNVTNYTINDATDENKKTRIPHFVLQDGSEVEVINRDENGDKALKISTIGTGENKIGFYRHLNRIPNYSKKTKVSLDVKFDTENFYITNEIMSAINETEDYWTNPSSVTFVSNSDKPAFNTSDGSVFNYVPGKWYTLSVVFDTENDKAELYVDDKCIRTVTGFVKRENDFSGNTLAWGEGYDALTSLTVSQFKIYNPAVTADNPEYYYVDNFKVEVYAYDFSGVESYGFIANDDSYKEGTTVDADAKALAIKFIDIISDESVVTATYNDGSAVAGTSEIVTVDGASMVRFTPDVFSADKDITITVDTKMEDVNGNIYDVTDYSKTYTVKDADGNVLSDITFEEDGEFVKAVIKTKSDSYKEIGYLYIVGYTEGGARVTTVNMVKVDATTFESVKVAKVPVLDETAVYKAYVWNFTNQPMKSSEMLNK